MHVMITSFNGSPNLGLYGFVNDKFGLIGEEVPQDVVEEMEKILKIPLHKITIAGTSLIGVFVTGTNQKIIVPSIIFDEEKERLDEIGAEYEVFETKHTCLGNNILITQKASLISPEYNEEEAKKISEIFGVKTSRQQIAGMNTVGNLIVANKDKALVTNEISEKEYKEIQEILGVDATPGSVNMGSGYVKSGILVNENGFIIGKQSGGPEVINAEQALGFLEY